MSDFIFYYGFGTKFIDVSKIVEDKFMKEYAVNPPIINRKDIMQIKIRVFLLIGSLG